MAKLPVISLAKNSASKSDTIAIILPADLKLPPIAKQIDPSGQLKRAISVSKFTGKTASALEVVAPANGADKIILVGCGEPAKNTESDWLKVGGKDILPPPARPPRLRSSLKPLSKRTLFRQRPWP